MHPGGAMPFPLIGNGSARIIASCSDVSSGLRSRRQRSPGLAGRLLDDLDFDTEGVSGGVPIWDVSVCENRTVREHQVLIETTSAFNRPSGLDQRAFSPAEPLKSQSPGRSSSPVTAQANGLS